MGLSKLFLRRTVFGLLIVASCVHSQAFGASEKILWNFNGSDGIGLESAGPTNGGDMRKLSLRTAICLVCVFCALAPIGLPAETLTTLVSFKEPFLNQGTAFGTLVQGLNGGIYGTTSESQANGDDAGTVFKITTAGKLTTLHHFCSEAHCADGIWPNGLLLASNGNFYGTTNAAGPKRGGTIFAITGGGKLTTFYSFCDGTGCTGGFSPDGVLV
jgi:uncharacterized repeat protein (TIGR03803 family)